MLLNDKPITINHRMGKIALHTVATKTAVLRVRKCADGSLETLGRVYGGSWDASSVKAHPSFLAAVREFLTKREDGGYYYIEEQNLAIVNRRFASVKQPTVKKAP